MHLGAEVDEDLRGRRAHARRRARHDHALALVLQHVRLIGQSFEGDRAFGAVLGADARLLGERAVDLGDEDLAVTEVVGREHVGRQHVATAVADTQIEIDAHLHGARSYAPGRAAPHVGLGVSRRARRAAACSGGEQPRHDRGTVADDTTAPAYPLDNTLRLDQVQVLGSHNSYHGRPYPQVLAALYKSTPGLARTLDYAHAPLPQQFALGVRQIELDVWSDPSGGKYARAVVPDPEGVHIPDNPVMHAPGLQDHPPGRRRHELDVPHVRRCACSS